MKPTLYTFIFTLVAFCGFSQNLAPNPSFESYSSLPNGYCQWNRCNIWNNVNGNTGCGTPGSPDYFHTNATSSVTLPNTSAGTVINPNTGNAIMGFLTWSGNIFPDYREYLAAPLTQPMVAGQTYEVSFYLSNGNTPYYGYGSNNIGIHFSNGPLSQTSFEVINVTPQVEITNVFFSNSWQLFTFTYTATANFTHMTIGNFKDDANTSAQQFYSPSQGRAYYYIDDISIVTASPTNVLTVSPDITICFGESVTLAASGDTNNVYNWANNADSSTILWTDSIWTFTPTSTATYNVYGSSDTASVTVTVDPMPTVDLGNDTSFCDGGSITLDTTFSAASYLWQDNSTGATYSVSQTGMYWVDVSLGNCVASDTINVIVDEVPIVDLGPDILDCQGGPILLNASYSGADYLWQDNSTSPTYSATQSGTFWVEVSLGNCSASDTINATIVDLSSLDLGEDTVICDDQSLILDASYPGANYLWQDNSTLASYTVVQEGIYFVTIDVNGCSASDTIQVGVESCAVILEIPNVFTPNGDNVNEVFVPVEMQGVESLNIIILNRWGEQVFESDELSFSWDAQDVSDGTYFWLVRYTSVKGDEYTQSGFVNVVRD